MVVCYKTKPNQTKLMSDITDVCDLLIKPCSKIDKKNMKSLLTYLTLS